MRLAGGLGTVGKNELHLAFSDLVYVVKQAGKEDKTILQGVSGSCAQGRLYTIMGPSGAGKSTLLDNLAGIPVQGRLEGTISLNGTPRELARFRKLSCYVMQKDVLLPSATVLEAIMTSALLQLPKDMPRSEKMDRVNSTLDILGLQRCANTLIGDETVQGGKGISGGEKRRVSVGVELVKEPKLVFLDEPTTGLDSSMAVSVMTTLKRLASSGKLIVCTIHQPNSDITEQFDDYMLLSGGQVAYEGQWDVAVDYFAGLGYSCPMYKNPTDYFMALISDKVTRDVLVGSRNKERDVESNDVDVGLTLTQAAGLTGLEAGPGSELGPRTQSDMSTPMTPFWYQTWVLAQRFGRSWMRDPLLFVSEVSQFAILAIFQGLLYFKLPLDIPNGVSDRLGAIFFVLATLCFVPSYTAVVVWDKERRLLRREYTNNTYRVSAFFAAKTLVTTPVEIFNVALYAVITYFMMGFALSAGNFFVYFAVMLAFTLASETIGHISAIVTRDATGGTILLTLLLIVLLAFSGFLVRTVPVYFKWIQTISYFNYATYALIQNEFGSVSFTTPDGEVVPGLEAVPQGMLNSLSLGANAGILAAIAVGLRVLAAGLTEAAARFGRL